MVWPVSPYISSQMKATFFLPILAYATRLVKEGTDLATEPIKAVGTVQPLPAFEEDTNK